MCRSFQAIHSPKEAVPKVHEIRIPFQHLGHDGFEVCNLFEHQLALGAIRVLAHRPITTVADDVEGALVDVAPSDLLTRDGILPYSNDLRSHSRPPAGRQ